ncbi:MAG: isopenicillin N synthase family dioxygenase [Acidimicrobiales bacterium]
MELGLVDLEAPVEEQVHALRTACETNGFFRLPLRSIPTSVADAAWELAREFFALPADEKSSVAFPKTGYPYGYSHYGREALGRSLGDDEALGDMKESFSVGPDCQNPTERAATRDAEAWIRSPSLWPTQIPELRLAWGRYYRALSDVSAQLMAVMALALDLPEAYFEPFFDRHITSMRALHYPVVTGPVAAALRAGAHTDYGTLTILRTDNVPGLQIHTASGWLDVPPDPETFVVNLGDTIAQWTNNRWRSTLHRVVSNEEPRQSMAFFHMANWDARIECLPTCRAQGEAPRHSPVQAGPWLMQKFKSTVDSDDR